MPDATTTCRVAICDDVDAFRLVLRIIFDAEHGLDVVGEAANGVEAIDLVRRERVDVLFLDVAMPEMDGVEALPHVLATSPGTRVVMLTGFGSDDVRQRVLDAGACRYVEKGAEPTELVSIAREVCDSPAA